jgi:Zn-dependent protease
MFIEYLTSDPSFFFGMALTIVFSICFHELAHGVAAVWLGDDTPIKEGRMTLNPLVHMGIFSLIMLLLAGVAWGQMPVREDRLRGRYGVALVAAAGPAMNAIIAFASLGALGLWMRFDSRLPEELPRMVFNLRYLMILAGYANIMLAIFNLIPVPPLDGSSIVRSLTPSMRDAMLAMRRAPIAFLLVFLVAGRFISPWSMTIASRFLKFVSGR